MDKETQVLEMAKILCPKGTANCEKCSKNYKCDVKFSQLAELFDGGCQIVGEDEIVIKKEDVDYITELYREKFGQVEKWRNLCDLKIKETARDIFEDIEFYGVRSLNDKVWGNHFKLTDYTILDLKIKYGIAKEKGIELED